ncbi:MAG: Zn-ribbon domain-containing OB-fold protein [Pseudomonadales bacterium]
MNAAANHLPAGLPAPRPARDGLDAPYYEALLSGKLLIQRCTACRGWQWGPEWICHRCLSFDLDWAETEPAGRIFSWERVWHPVHPALEQHGPYLVVLVELPQADHVRLVGNLLGDPHQPVRIGGAVEGVFEHHPDGEPPYTLLQWQLTG